MKIASKLGCTAAILAIPVILAGSAIFAEVRGLWQVPTRPGGPSSSPTPPATPPPGDAIETFYVRATGDGTAPETVAGAWDGADFNTAGNWTTDTGIDDGKIGPGDTVILIDDDGALPGLIPQGSGTEEYPITITGDGNGMPIVDGGASVAACPTGGEATTKLNGLLGYWDMEELSTGVAEVPREDATACGHDFEDPFLVASTATAHGGSRAARFEYVEDTDDNLELPDSESSSVFHAGLSHTFSMWLQILQGEPAHGKYVVKAINSQTREMAFEWQFCNPTCTEGAQTLPSHLHYTVCDPVVGCRQANVLPTDFDPADHLNEWIFVVFGHDAINNQVFVQINDGTIYTNSTVGISVPNTASPLKVGGLGNGGGSTDSIIDDLVLWNRVLTAAEKTSVFEDDLTGGPAAPAATSNALLINGKSWLIVSGIEFRGGDAGTEGVVYITGAGSDDNIIKDSKIGSSTQNGVLFSATAGARNQIRDNEIHSNSLDGISAAIHVGSDSLANATIISGNEVHSNTQDGIRINANYWTVTDNHVHTNGSAGDFDGIHTYSALVGDGVGDNNLITYNLVHGNVGTGEHGAGIFVDRFSADNTLYYNLVYDNDGPGIALNDAATTTLWNNTSYGNLQAGLATEKAEIRLASTATDSTTVIAKNNLAVATAADTYAIYIDAEVSNNTLDITTNDWWRATGDWYFFNATPGAVIATWNALVSGIGTDISDDPLFEDAGTQVFDILTGSPCAEAGTDVGLAFDFEGEGIIGVVDIGAYEGPPGIPNTDAIGGGWEAAGHLGGVGTPVFDTCTVIWNDANSSSEGGAGSSDRGGNPTCVGGGTYPNCTLKTSQGSFRQCVNPSTARIGPRLVNFSVSGTITTHNCNPDHTTPPPNGCAPKGPPWTICPANTAGSIIIDQPYLTIDGFTAPDPGITILKRDRGQGSPDCGPGLAAITVKMTHDIIIRGLRIQGHYNPALDDGGDEVQLFMMDGDGNRPTCSTWDDVPACPTCPTGATACDGGQTQCGAPDHGSIACTGNRDIMLSNLTIRNANDEAGVPWEDTRKVTRQHIFWYKNWHPAGCQAGGLDTSKARRYITDYGNVSSRNGDRTPKLTKNCRDMDILNNFVHDWRDENPSDGNTQGFGIHLDSSGAFGSHGLNARSNVFLPGRNGNESGSLWNPDWDCWEAGNPGANIQPCPNASNPFCKVFFAGNLFASAHNANTCISRPATETVHEREFPLPALLDVWGDLSAGNIAAIYALIQEAGMPYPDAEEQAVLDDVKADWLTRATRCTVTANNCQSGYTP